jgi:hypothetical protein
MPAVKPDITIENHGSVVLLRAASPVGKAWIEAYVDRDGSQPAPGSLSLATSSRSSTARSTPAWS